MDRRAFLVKSGSVTLGVGLLSLNSGLLDGSVRGGPPLRPPLV